MFRYLSTPRGFTLFSLGFVGHGVTGENDRRLIVVEDRLGWVVPMLAGTFGMVDETFGLPPAFQSVRIGECRNRWAEGR